MHSTCITASDSMLKFYVSFITKQEQNNPVSDQPIHPATLQTKITF